METLKVAVGRVEVELLADDRICQSVISGKPFEPDTLDAWAQMCRPGTTVIDVGGYSGLFSIAAAKLGASPVAIEPLPVMQDRIAENANINGVEVRVIPGAASDQSGKFRIGYNDKVHLTSGASLLRRSGPGLMVDTFRLDDLDLPGPVAAIKIDVERHELAVIEGAAGIISRDRPDLIVEFLDPEARERLMKALAGYRSFRVMDTRNLIVSNGAD